MARAAVEQAVRVPEGNGIQLKNVIWARPILVRDEPIRVQIGLIPECALNQGDFAFGEGDAFSESGKWRNIFEIYGEPEKTTAGPVIYCQGTASLIPPTAITALDLKNLQTQCDRNILTSSQCYEAFQVMGIDYGPGHGDRAGVCCASQVLAKLALPSTVADSIDQFVLHPSLMDAALRASIWLSQDSGNLKLYLPFALQRT